jgi:hypothetical protein
MRKGDTNPNSATFSVVNAEDRLFKIWATVEVFDTQGQRVPIEIFKAVVPKLLSRTVPFHLEHTNKAVGEAVNYEFGMHPELNAEGCLVTGKIYRGFQLDDEAWRGVQQNSLMASIGGQSSSNKPGDLDWVAPCEIALTKKGANPGARIMEVAAMAKSDMGKASFPPAIKAKLDDFVKHFDDFTTSDLQGAVGALANNDPQLDEDEMLDYIYDKVKAMQKSMRKTNMQKPCTTEGGKWRRQP